MFKLDGNAAAGATGFVKDIVHDAADVTKSVTGGGGKSKGDNDYNYGDYGYGSGGNYGGYNSGGYKGRIALQEVLLISPEIRDAVNAKSTKVELRKLVYGSDVITLLQDGLYKVIAGLTSIEEVIKLTEADDEINAETRINAMTKSN